MKDSRNYSLAKNQLRNLLFKNRFRRRYNHHHKSFTIQPGSSLPNPKAPDDILLIERLKKFYLLCDANFDGNKDSVWSSIFMQMQGDIHAAFINNHDEKIIEILCTPGKYNLFYGFENLCRDLVSRKRLEDLLEPEMAMDSLISLCEAVGVINIANPESLRIKKAITAEEAIVLLEKEFGFTLFFPNPFEGEYGLQTKKGIVSYRAVQAVYQAWKIAQIVVDIDDPKVLEIGGGLGRTAFYCRLFGISDYTIVDIPMSSLSQGNFLGRVLSQNDVWLSGEETESHNMRIKLEQTKDFFSSDTQYDLIVNVDSLTELDVTIAKKYLNKIKEKGKLFLSVNHEHNSFTVNSISKETQGLKKLYRQLYWLRRGYVEELFEKN